MTDESNRERAEWLRTAKRLGIDVARGEPLDSIKEKVQRYDEGAFEAIAGMPAPSATTREGQ